MAIFKYCSTNMFNSGSYNMGIGYSSMPGMFSMNSVWGSNAFDMSSNFQSANFQSNNFPLFSAYTNPFADFKSITGKFDTYTQRDFKIDFGTYTANKKTNNVFSTKNYNTKINLPQLSEIQYNSEKAKKLAGIADRGALNHSTGYCARYVKNAIQNSGLGQYEMGHAYSVGNILSDNKNFKKVNVSGNELKNLPAGCILVYDKGSAGYSSQYGHVEITLGNGKAASDFVNSNIRASEKVQVFVPV